MTAGVSAHLRRGFDSTVANWPLMAVGVAFHIIMVFLFLFSVAIAAIPLVIAGIFSVTSLQGSDPGNIARDFVFTHPLICIYVVLVLGLIFIPLTIVFTFFEIGKVSELLRAERAGIDGQPRSFRVFDFHLWWRAAVQNWWPAFLVLNVVWSIVLLIVLVPLAIAAVVALVSGGSKEGLLAGCAVAALALLLAVPLCLLGNVWTQFAFFELVATRERVAEVCRRSLRQIRANLSEVALTVGALMLISFGGMLSLILLQISIGALAHVPGLALLLVPAQVLVSLVQSAVGIFLSVWGTATLASLYRSPVA